MSLWDNKDDEPWDKDVPADLVPAIKHLRHEFELAHFKVGWVTRQLCYAQLHEGRKKAHCTDSEFRDYQEGLVWLRSFAGKVATQKFDAALKVGTPPAIFKAFYDFYLDCLTPEILRIFTAIAMIGRANQCRLASGHIEWAEIQAKQLIRSQRHVLEIWVIDVCDDSVFDLHASGSPGGDPFERYFGKWHAPTLLIMEPVHFQRYDPARNWERNPNETSLQWLESIADSYVIRLESDVRDVAGAATVALAMQPQPPVATDPLKDSYSKEPPKEAQPLGELLEEKDLARRESLLKRVQAAPTGATFKYEDAASVFGVTTRSIRNWIEEGKLSKAAKRGYVTAESIKRILHSS